MIKTLKTARQIIEENKIHLAYSDEEINKLVVAMEIYANQYRNSKPVYSNLGVYTSKTLGGKHCYYCGIELYENVNKSKDHFWPKSLGGTLKVYCCLTCNALKKNMTPMGFVKHLRNLKKHTKDKFFINKLDRMIKSTTDLWSRVKWSI